MSKGIPPTFTCGLSTRESQLWDPVPKHHTDPELRTLIVENDTHGISGHMYRIRYKFNSTAD
jgi:hypothetical protein